ncbi:cytochrome P450 [Saccharopolyspora sp. WRP15-2]|uniref:Cytochrome P450 n=1 Tax=Saccharopolyspora oryzae TaxID=2997343 RepID=A0ABT4V691_9PSEU|nr:cytochrome P450 [Saccharopolyspora oryzae]MDA3628817.1 cytochrome P450 [Saccharopolyspora oryzae]
MAETTTALPNAGPDLADIDLMDMAMFAAGEDDAAFRVLRDRAPLFWNDEPGDGPGFWSVTRYADVDAVAKNAAVFSSADGTQIQSRRAEGKAHSMHNMDDPRHLLLRRITVGSFTAKRVENWRDRVHEVTTALLDEAVDQGQFDFVELVSERLPLLIFATMLGVPREDAPLLLRWTNMIASEDPDHAPDPDSLAKARTELFDYFHGLAAERRKEPRDDLVSLLVHAEVEGQRLQPDELDPYFLLLTVAGNETTRNLLSGSVAILGQTGQWGRLAADPDLLTPGMEEMLRWVSPVINMRRTALVDTELHGQQIRAGEKVVLWFSSANRDERVFDEPDTFRLDRTPNRHLAFGSGSHFCLGAHLARLEIRTFYQELHARGIRFELAAEPVRLLSNWFRGIKSMPVETRRGGKS